MGRRHSKGGPLVSPPVHRWAELRAGPMSNAMIRDAINNTTAEIRAAALRNYKSVRAIIMGFGRGSGSRVC